MKQWNCVLELDATRTVAAGSPEALVSAIRAGADLRIGTEFVHNEHIDVHSDSAERIREVAEFGVTYVIDGRWAAGIMSLRQPVSLPDGFGPRPSMSFFLYNQDGRQAIARPFLDGAPVSDEDDAFPDEDPDEMPKQHIEDEIDNRTNAPSSNFMYDFDMYRYHVCRRWQEMLHHSADGSVVSGSVEALADAFSDGAAVKAGVSGLCADLCRNGACPEHELFVEVGSCYYYLDQRLFIAGSHPVVRVRPAIPMRYESRGWDFGWLVLRTDGRVVYRRCDPYTLAFSDHPCRHPIRWFVSR